MFCRLFSYTIYVVVAEVIVKSKHRTSVRSWISKGRSGRSRSIFSDLNLMTKRNAVVDNGTALPAGAVAQGLGVAGGGGVPRIQPLPTSSESQQGSLTTKSP